MESELEQIEKGEAPGKHNTITTELPSLIITSRCFNDLERVVAEETVQIKAYSIVDVIGTAEHIRNSWKMFQVKKGE